MDKERKHSIFYRLHNKEKFIVSLFFMESLSKIISKEENVDMAKACVAALIVTGQIESAKDASQKDLEELASRVVNLYKKEVEVLTKMQEDPPAKKKKSFGMDFIEKYSEMPMDHKCLFACDNDIEKARVLYCEVDKEIADEIINLSLEMKWQDIKTRFEAAVYGFGGSFGGSSPEEGVIDLTSEEGRASANQQLRSLGL